MKNKKELAQVLRQYATQIEATHDKQISEDLREAADFIECRCKEDYSYNRDAVGVTMIFGGATEKATDTKLYDWDGIYERKMDKGYGDPELTAYDNARYYIECCMTEEGIDVENAECPEEEIDFWLANQSFVILFDEDGNFVKQEPKNA